MRPGDCSAYGGENPGLSIKPTQPSPWQRTPCDPGVEPNAGKSRPVFTRLTYAFNKKWENLRAALALHFAYYNFCRIVRTIKATLAMAAGPVASRWILADLLAA